MTPPVSKQPGASGSSPVSKQTQGSVDQCFRRCDGCFTDRTCYEYAGLWLCKGPQRCWSKRKVMNKNKDEKRRKRR